MTEAIPMLSADLIAQLDQRVPSGVPSPGQPIEEIWMNVGMRKLVDNLKMRLEDNDTFKDLKTETV